MQPTAPAVDTNFIIAAFQGGGVGMIPIAIVMVLVIFIIIEDKRSNIVLAYIARYIKLKLYIILPRIYLQILRIIVYSLPLIDILAALLIRIDMGFIRKVYKSVNLDRVSLPPSYYFSCLLSYISQLSWLPLLPVSVAYTYLMYI